ncbi:hypothetical protein GCM10009555_003580 [Acrocarpospora macrocephala]
MASGAVTRVVHGVWSDGREYAALVPAPIATAESCGGFGEAEEAARECDAILSGHRRADQLVTSLEQAAVGYAQLEFIHPFMDGNGRLGRCLMQVIPRRRGLVGSLVPPLGLLFAANMPRFLEAHRRYREGDRAFWCRYVAELAVTSAANVHVLLGRNGRKEKTHGSIR